MNNIQITEQMKYISQTFPWFLTVVKNKQTNKRSPWLPLPVQLNYWKWRIYFSFLGPWHLFHRHNSTELGIGLSSETLCLAFILTHLCRRKAVWGSCSEKPLKNFLTFPSEVFGKLEKGRDHNRFRPLNEWSIEFITYFFFIIIVFLFQYILSSSGTWVCICSQKHCYCKLSNICFLNSSQAFQVIWCLRCANYMVKEFSLSLSHWKILVYVVFLTKKISGRL